MEKFNDISEIISDEIFASEVERLLREIRIERGNRSNPKPGFFYKKDSIDKLMQEGKFNHNYFLVHIEDIWMKKSNLSSSIRYIIQYVCGESLRETLKYYKQQEETK